MKLYHIDFEAIPWESQMPGIKQKVIQHGSKRIRLVEYSKDMKPHWCEKGHSGYILSGRFEIEFDDGIRIFDAGDGVLIPGGEEHRHRAKVLSDAVRAIFVEDV
jgi:mannose-6-phosphate isomerase-like protein (cupin superfamily)